MAALRGSLPSSRLASGTGWRARVPPTGVPVQVDAVARDVQPPSSAAIRAIEQIDCDVVVELTPTDLVTAEPAIDHVRAALGAGRHVVTTNKGPVALYFPELAALAAAENVKIGVEGTVMSGTPTMWLGDEALRAAGVTRIEGILNGTTNYILTQMAAGADYADALADAQALGFAEADPTGDVEGFDAAAKVVILGNLLMGGSLTMADVKRSGMSGLTADDISSARAAGCRWKLVGTVERAVAAGQLEARVELRQLPDDDPLASVSGATNAITFGTDLLGNVTLVGPGAGRVETGVALLVDLLAIHRATS